MKIGFDDVGGDPKRLRCDREGRVHGRRGWQDGCVDDEEIGMVKGAAKGIERRHSGVGADAHSATLM